MSRDLRFEIRDSILGFFCCYLFFCAVFSTATFATQAMDPLFYKGKEIFVTAHRYPKLRVESPFSTSVITRKDIWASGAKNLGEALQYEVGIDYKTSGSLGTTSSLKLRGSTYEQVLVLINGRRANSSLLGGFAPEDFSLDRVERIEVVRFPVSSLYGADAMGGVINIITRKPQAGIDLAVEYGTYNTQKYLLSCGNDALDVSFDYLSSNGFRTNDDFKAQNYASSLKLANVQFDFGHYVGEKGVPGSAVYPLPTTRQTDRKSYLNLVWGGFKTYYDEKLQIYNANPTVEADSNYNGWTSGVEWQNTSKLGRHVLVYGLDWREDRGDSDASGLHTVNNLALFLQDEIALSKRWSVNLGAREDWHSVIGSNLSVRVGSVTKLRKDLRFKIGYGQAYRAPTLNELYWYYFDPVWGIVTRGDSTLKPEKANSIDVGLERQIDAHTKAAINYYNTNTQDLIKWIDTSGTWMTWEAQNIARTKAEGVEFEFTRSFGKRIQGFLNYTYQNAVDLDTNNKLVYTPESKINVGLAYQNPNGDGSSVNARYVSECFDNEANTNRVPGYTVVDLKLWRRVCAFVVSLDVDNLFSEQYEVTLNYPMPGRKIMVGLKWDPKEQ